MDVEFPEDQLEAEKLYHDLFFNSTQRKEFLGEENELTYMAEKAYDDMLFGKNGSEGLIDIYPNCIRSVLEKGLSKNVNDLFDNFLQSPEFASHSSFPEYSKNISLEEYSVTTLNGCFRLWQF